MLSQLFPRDWSAGVLIRSAAVPAAAGRRSGGQSNGLLARRELAMHAAEGETPLGTAGTMPALQREVFKAMKLLIDNLDGVGPLDYTAFIDLSDAANNPAIARKLNAASALTLGLISGERAFTVPALNARVLLTLANGHNLFTGYLVATPAYEYVGEADGVTIYRYKLSALSDVMPLDQKAPPPHPPFVDRAAGDAFRQLAEDALPGWFNESGVEAGDSIPYYSVDPAKKWTASAAEIALAARCSYRDDNGALFFTPLGANTYALAEDDPSFSPSDLQLQSVSRLVNDISVLGPLEPSAHVKDYFVGDGVTSKFYLSQKPFTRSNQILLYNRTVLEENYAELDPTHWTVTDPSHAISVSAGQLQIAGGTGIDSQTLLTFIEKIELGGTTEIDHGDIAFNAASNGVVGGLYPTSVSIANCLAGFRVTPFGANSTIQALVEGALTGPTITTQPGHHYVFTTQLYPAEVYRIEQVFHSSPHASGNPRGGGEVACDVRVLLEVHDIDPTNPATQIAPATVLFDGVISNAPGFCTYALIDSLSMECTVAFTDIWLPVDALVRCTPSGGATVTVPTGSLLDGAACHVSTEPALQFYSNSIPAANTAIEVTYRGESHAAARVIDSASIAAHQQGGDDGVRGSLHEITIPLPRTSADCETAALALLDDAGQGWAGEYQAWSQFLPGDAVDIFPGDALAINVPSRMADMTAIIREVDVKILDIAGENSRYTLRFVDAGDPALDFAFATALVRQSQVLTPIDVTEVGDTYLADLTNAEVIDAASTTVTIDVGFTPVAGGGIEVRYSDLGWGIANSGNLVGRFTSSSFTVTRYARGQTYFLRSYDGSGPPKYSRYSAALHVDYPL